MDLAKWLGVGTALILAGPILWYKLRDFFVDVDEGNFDDDRQTRRGYVEERVDRFGTGLRLIWQLLVPVIVFVIAYAASTSVFDTLLD